MMLLHPFVFVRTKLSVLHSNKIAVHNRSRLAVNATMVEPARPTPPPALVPLALEVPSARIVCLFP